MKGVDLEAVGAWYVDFVMKHHYAPTVREVCAFSGVTSSSSGHRIMQALLQKGYINGVREKPWYHHKDCCNRTGVRI